MLEYGVIHERAVSLRQFTATEREEWNGLLSIYINSKGSNIVDQ